jgi:hypothetical protein
LIREFYYMTDLFIQMPYNWLKTELGMQFTEPLSIQILKDYLENTRIVI